MSNRKCSNFRHRLQTSMPRPPQSAHRELFGFVHRWIMFFQHLNVLVSPCLRVLWPCFRLASEVRSRCRHPQDFVLPDTSLLFSAMNRVPQSHKTSLLARPSGVDGASAKTESLVNLWPTLDIRLDMALVLSMFCKWRAHGDNRRSLRFSKIYSGVQA